MMNPGPAERFQKWGGTSFRKIHANILGPNNKDFYGGGGGSKCEKVHLCFVNEQIIFKREVRGQYNELFREISERVRSASRKFWLIITWR